MLLHGLMVIILGYCLLQAMAAIWAMLLLLSGLLLSLFALRRRPKIRRLSQLDQQDWVIFDGRQQQQVRLLQIQNWGVCVLLRLHSASSEQHLQLCIVCDQLSWPQWCRLQRLARHSAH